MKTLLSATIILICFSCKSKISTPSQVFTKSKQDTIPFILTEHNNFSIAAFLNNKDSLDLMFHTAVNSVSLTPDMCKKLNTNKVTKSSQANSWTGSSEVEYVEDNTLSIGNMKWDSLTVWLDMLSGPETDGKFGPNLFEGKIIEINNDKKFITLHEPENFEPNASIYSTYQLSTDENDSLLLEGSIDIGSANVSHKFLLHSGYGGTIILDDQFKRANKGLDSLTVLVEKDLKDSFGNIIKTKKVQVDRFNIFGTAFDNMPLSYFDSKIEIQKTSVLGGELLKRFNIFLDIEKMEIHISKSSLALEPFKTT